MMRKANTWCSSRWWRTDGDLVTWRGGMGGFRSICQSISKTHLRVQRRLTMTATDSCRRRSRTYYTALGKFNSRRMFARMLNRGLDDWKWNKHVFHELDVYFTGTLPRDCLPMDGHRPKWVFYDDVFTNDFNCAMMSLRVKQKQINDQDNDVFPRR